MPPTPPFSRRLFSTAIPSGVWSLLRSNASSPHLESALSLSIPAPTPSLVSSVLSSADPSSPSDLLLSLRLFVWAGLRPSLRHSAAAFSSAASLLRIPTRPHLLHALLDSYSPDRVDIKTFSLLLRLSPRFDLSLSLLRRMPEFSVRPDVPSFNSLLRLSPPPAVAAQLFQELSLSGLRPDIITYMILVSSFSSAGLVGCARSLLPRMRADGCEPNVAVYSAVLDGACGRGDVDAAKEIFEEMERVCSPNVVTYTCLMKCLCEKGRLDEALEVLDRMGMGGCRPNRVTLRTLIKGFCDRGRVDEAYGFVENVLAEGGGGISSEECYSLLVVSLLRTGDRSAAEGLLGRMLERGVMPDGLACNSFMRDLCAKKCFLDGYEWVGKLGCVDSDVYCTLLEGLCKEGHSAEAVELARRVVESDSPVGASCAEAVITVLERIGCGGMFGAGYPLKRKIIGDGDNFGSNPLFEQVQYRRHDPLQSFVLSFN